MTWREVREDIERNTLSPYAALSCNSMGRDRHEDECDIRPAYQRDRDRILHCKSFRRMKHKTQVFLAPEGDHYRTRLTHTLEVSQIARTIARALMLNEDLTEAIALGHDLGHTPFGHSGEAVLDEVYPEGFKHYRQSIRVVEFIEKNGQGLNLTKEVRDGIANHGTHGKPSTLEGGVVRLSDKIAYINHDIDDSIRAKIFDEKNIPKQFTDILGANVRDRLNNLVHDVIKNSMEQPAINMSDDMYSAMMGLREWLFENVYHNTDSPKAEEGKAKELLHSLYDYYIAHPEKMPAEYQYFMNECAQGLERTVCDYIAGMTDQYAIEKYTEIFIPIGWKY